MTASVINLNPKRPHLTPVANVLPVIAPSNIEIDGDCAKITIIRRLDAEQLRELGDYLHRLADRLESKGGAA